MIAKEIQTVGSIFRFLPNMGISSTKQLINLREPKFSSDEVRMAIELLKRLDLIEYTEIPNRQDRIHLTIKGREIKNSDTGFVEFYMNQKRQNVKQKNWINENLVSTIEIIIGLIGLILAYLALS